MAGEVVDGSATWALVQEGHSVDVTSESVARVAIRARGHGTDQGTNAGVNPGSEVHSQPTLAAEVTEWLREARSPVARASIRQELVTAKTLAETEQRSLNAFWSLLQAACYEEW